MDLYSLPLMKVLRILAFKQTQRPTIFPQDAWLLNEIHVFFPLHLSGAELKDT